MIRYTVILVLFIVFAAAGISGAAERSKKKGGEAGFKKNCAVCHPDGGNVINPGKTLHKKDLQTNKITKTEDIVKIMRNPGPGMTRFDEKTIPDKEAKKIAEYVLKTFK